LPQFTPDSKVQLRYYLSRTHKQYSETIPFNFVIEGKLFRRAITMSWKRPRRVIIREANAKASSVALANTVEPASSNAPVRLAFHRYGNRYFLAQVWIPGRYHGTFSASRAEREVAARAGQAGGDILVALRQNPRAIVRSLS
jgi:hypothetical protein